jgi:hypothetical protein
LGYHLEHAAASACLSRQLQQHFPRLRRAQVLRQGQIPVQGRFWQCLDHRIVIGGAPVPWPPMCNQGNLRVHEHRAGSGGAPMPCSSSCSQERWQVRAAFVDAEPLHTTPKVRARTVVSLFTAVLCRGSKNVVLKATFLSIFELKSMPFKDTQLGKTLQFSLAHFPINKRQTSVYISNPVDLSKLHCSLCSMIKLLK